MKAYERSECVGGRGRAKEKDVIEGAGRRVAIRGPVKGLEQGIIITQHGGFTWCCHRVEPVAHLQVGIRIVLPIKLNHALVASVPH